MNQRKKGSNSPMKASSSFSDTTDYESPDKDDDRGRGTVAVKKEPVTQPKTLDLQSSNSATLPQVTMKKVLTRTATAVAMTAAYMGLLHAGHFYIIISMVATQVQ